jgi:hypothetical protein
VLLAVSLRIAGAGPLPRLLARTFSAAARRTAGCISLLCSAQLLRSQIAYLVGGLDLQLHLRASYLCSGISYQHVGSVVGSATRDVCTQKLGTTDA